MNALVRLMPFKDALSVLMQAATNDVQGSGLGYRNTTDEWRDRVSEAWTVAFIRLNKRWPDDNEFFNARMRKPNDTAHRQDRSASGGPVR